MKKNFLCCILISALVLLLCGCEQEDAPVTDSEDSGLASDAEKSGMADVSTILELGHRDNSLDAYSAVINTPLIVEKPEGAMQGGGSACFLGTTKAYYFKKHLFNVPQESWDELASVTSQGEADSVRWNSGEWQFDIGSVLGSDHYLVVEGRSGSDGYSYYLAEMDENSAAVLEMPLTFLDYDNNMPSGIMADASGNIHIIVADRPSDSSQENHYRYIILSPEGGILTEYDSGAKCPFFVPIYEGSNGSVAFETFEDRDGVGICTLQRLDKESGEVEVLAELEEPSTKYYDYTLLDENTLVYADAEGVYRRGLSETAAEPLYLWHNHGITVSGVSAMQLVGEDRIALVYESDEEKNYLYLEPTTEEVGIQQITLAVSPYKEEVYRAMATEFNRRYPGCHIEVKSDFEETTLLTELIANSGPVLCDTSLVGFEEHVDLWEPLDSVLDELGILGELQESAMEFGKIDGSFYGVVTNFWLETVVAGEGAPQSWDYDGFLECIGEHPDMESIFNCDTGGNYGTTLIMGFLMQDLEDNYFIDAENGETRFDSREFRNVLELAKRYCVHKEAVMPGDSLLEGRVLCNTLAISHPEQLALYRVCYGKDANYIGYPSAGGSRHYINGDAPLTIRKTATKEEKELAYAFISTMLSYEGQVEAAKEVNFSLSVRKDLLEEQIDSMDEDSYAIAFGFEQMRLGDNLDKEQDRKMLYDLLDKAQPRRNLPRPLRDILVEELNSYFDGTITEDMLIEHLENRVQLYLDEQR